MIPDGAPATILENGLNQFLMFGLAAPDSIARLRGAISYQKFTGVVLLDETRACRKQPSALWIERIPPQGSEAVQDE